MVSCCGFVVEVLPFPRRFLLLPDEVRLGVAVAVDFDCSRGFGRVVVGFLGVGVGFAMTSPPLP